MAKKKGKTPAREPAGKIATEAHRQGNTMGEVCDTLGKSFPYIRLIQSRLGLPILEKDGYPENYIAFLNTVVALRSFSVPLEDIGELFETEKKLLKLLKVDTLSRSLIWYLDACGAPSSASNRLLLTNHDIQSFIRRDGIQFNLDFGERDRELFTGREMGEDVRRVMAKYQRLLGKVLARVREEEVVLREALVWASAVFPDDARFKVRE